MAEQETRTRMPLTVTLDGPLYRYLNPKTGTFYQKTLIKPTQLVQAAIEAFFKENGHWEHYQEFVKSEVEETY